MHKFREFQSEASLWYGVSPHFKDRLLRVKNISRGYVSISPGSDCYTPGMSSYDPF